MEMSVILELDVSQVRMICNALDYYGEDMINHNKEKGLQICKLSNSLFALIEPLED